MMMTIFILHLEVLRTNLLYTECFHYILKCSLAYIGLLQASRRSDC